MGNIVSYAREYRSVAYGRLPFGAADSLILSQLVYYNYAGSLFEAKNPVQTVHGLLSANPEPFLVGLMTIAKDRRLITALLDGERHGGLRAFGYEEWFDAESGDQFAALIFELGKEEYYIAFRGTDNSVAGWKEDLSLSFKREIPSQRAALRYAEEAMERLPGRFYLGGHSKGGNLAVYCGMYLKEALKGRLAGVYNHDGPGFAAEIYKSEAYWGIRPLIRKTIPQSSIVGLLWEGDRNYTVVRSRARPFAQHDPYTWEISGSEFAVTDRPDSFSLRANRVVTEWLSQLSLEERQRIVESIFDAISDVGIRKFYEMTDRSARKAARLLRNVAGIRAKDKRLILVAVMRLAVMAAGEWRQTLQEKGVRRLSAVRQYFFKCEK